MRAAERARGGGAARRSTSIGVGHAVSHGRSVAGSFEPASARPDSNGYPILAINSCDD